MHMCPASTTTPTPAGSTLNWKQVNENKRDLCPDHVIWSLQMGETEQKTNGYRINLRVSGKILLKRQIFKTDRFPHSSGDLSGQSLLHLGNTCWCHKLWIRMRPCLRQNNIFDLTWWDDSFYFEFCTCNLLLNISTILASLDSPRTWNFTLQYLLTIDQSTLKIACLSRFWYCSCPALTLPLGR